MSWTRPFVLALLVALSANGRADVPEGGRPAAPPDLVPSGLSVVAERRTFTATVKLPGEIRSTRRHEVVSHYRYWMVVRWMADEGSTVAEGDPVAVVQNEVIETRVARREREVRRARVRADRLRARSRMARIEAAQAVRTAGFDLRRAELQLQALEEGAPKEDMRLAEIECDRRRLERDAAAAALARVKELADAGLAAREIVREREYKHRVAEARLARAEADLVSLKHRPAELELRDARHAVAVAEARLEAARQAETAAREQRSAEIAWAEQETNVRRADLQRWLSCAENEIRRAPMSGIVVHPPIYVGGKARPGVGPLWTATIAAIVDPSQWAFVARATEEDVAQIAVGQAAEVTVPALPGTKLAGKVAAVAVTADDLSRTVGFARDEERQESGVNVYDVVIQVEAGEGLDLPQGMSGEAMVTLREPRLATVVPRACVRERGGEGWLLVRRGSGWHPRRIEIAGEHDGMAVVASGLEPGDEVAILSE